MPRRSTLHLYKIPKKDDNTKNYCKLIIVIVLSVVFIGGEILGGILSHSISVISDATHLITDLVGFVISYVFLYCSDKAPNKKNSFGFHRMEIIGALGNLFVIWCITIFLIYEATNRIINKEFVEDPKVMLIVAGVGLVVNIVMYFVLHTGKGGHSHGLGQSCSHDHADQEERERICGNCKKPQENQGHQCLLDDNNDSRTGSFNAINGESLNEIKPAEVIELKVLPPVRPPARERSPIKQNHEHGHECNHAHQNNGHKKMEKQHENQHENQHNCDGHKHTHKNGEKQSHKHEHKHDHNHDDSHSHHQHDHSNENTQSISMKAAILHALTDIIQSIGLLISALIIFFVGSDKGAPVTQFNNWHYLDPLSTYLFSILVIVSTWPITKQCYYIILEATPEELDSDAIYKQFQEVEGVKDLHDFHVWQLRPTKVLLTAHVFSEPGLQKTVLHELTTICRRHKIYHTTIQVQQWQHRMAADYIRCDHDIH